MDWTSEKQVQLEDYINTYLDQLKDISKFYTNIDWERVTKTTNCKNVEFLNLKIDELFDLKVFSQDLNPPQLVSLWGTKESSLYTDVSRMIDSIGLLPFKEVTQETNANAESEQPRAEIGPNQKAHDMPRLTKNQRRLSLDLMQPRPNPDFTGKDGQLVTPAATSITNLSVTTRSKPVLEHHSSGQLASTTRPELKTRPTSLVGEQLPKYIREQLRQAQPAQIVSPKTATRKHLPNKLPTIEDTREVSRKSSRLQNLVTASQSLHAHSQNFNSTTNTSDVERHLRYDSDDDDREYILPGLLAKYYGVQLEDGSDVDYDDEEEEEEDDDDDEEEDVDFVNVGGSVSNDDDENDYLFKV